jgi:superfamily II DNA or RNA helicase
VPRDLRSAIEWEPTYNPHKHNLLEDFYIPVLSNTVFARRCVGYFRSSALAAASVGYEKFCEHPDAKMKLIVGLEFTKDDHDRILFTMNPDEIEEGVREMIEKELTGAMPDFARSRLAGLSWMLNNDKMEIKFGVMLDKKTKKPLPWEQAKWHHKITAFEDELGNSASINGSINESEQAWTRNGDSFSTSPSWKDTWAAKTVESNVDLFDEIWEVDGFDKGLDVGIFTIDDLPERWKRFVAPIKPGETMEWPGFESGEVASEEEEWAHKIKARELFLKDRDPSAGDDAKKGFPAGKQGILSMATGTGKTMTALRIARQMLEEDMIDNIIITTLRGSVLNQWDKEINDPIKQSKLLSLIDVQYRSFAGKNQTGKYMFSSWKRKLFLTGKRGFEDLVRKKSDLDRTLLIVDECHNFRGEGHRAKTKGIYQKIPFRLGLSATPESEYNDEANDFMFKEIGPLFFNYELDEAIRDKILCPFEYHPMSYTPDPETIRKVRKIMAGKEKEKKENPNADLTMYFIRMAREYKICKGKLPSIKKLFDEDQSILDRCIIFGPEVEFNDYLREFLNELLDVRWDQYYGGTDKLQLESYPHITKVLLSCKALGEGVDLPVNNVVLVASEKTRLETIQRIGRSLRTHGDPKKVARIYDFIRDNDENSPDHDRAEWLGELSRMSLENMEEE